MPVERRGKHFEGIINVADWYGTLTELVGVDMKASEWQIRLWGWWMECSLKRILSKLSRRS